jgi:YbbR domain-containing protein
MISRPFRHLGLKVLSLALAVLLWFLIAGQKEAERSLRIPLEFQNIPERLEIVEEPPNSVDVRVRGPAGSLGQVRAGEIVAVLDLGAARAGRRLFHLQPENVSAPSGLRVVHVLPATVALTFEPSSAKTVPVVPVVEGEPAAGYVVGAVSANPPTVRITGPESALQRLTEATTEPVSVDGRTAGVRERVNVGLDEEAARLQGVRTALVTVDIQRAPAERVISGVRLEVRNLATGVRAEVEPVMISAVVKGASGTIDKLGPESIPAFVEVSGLAKGRYNVPVRLEPTEQFSVIATKPDQVEVRIR